MEENENCGTRISCMVDIFFLFLEQYFDFVNLVGKSQFPGISANLYILTDSLNLIIKMPGPEIMC